MGTFQEEQKILIVWTTISGLYMPSIEQIISCKFVTQIFKCAVLIPTIGLSVMMGSSIKCLVWDEGDFLIKTYAFAFIINISLMLFKLLYYNFNRNNFEKIFNLWDSSFKEELFSERRAELLRQTKKTTNRYITVLCVLGLLSCMLWAIPPYFNPEKKLTQPSGLEYRHESPDYELVVTYELVVSLYTGTLGTCFDGVFMVLLSLEKTELIHLQTTLAEIIDDLQVDYDGDVIVKKGNKILCKEKTDFDVEMKEKRKKILTWISHHQQLLRFHDEVRKIYYTPLCVIFGIIVISICLVAFLNIVGALTAMETAVSLIFFGGSYSMFYFTCQFGDIINDTSANLFQEAFSKAWYVYPKPIKTLFHIVIMRCQRPLDIVAFDVYPLGARSFYKIFKTAYTFFTMLMQLVKKRDFMKSKQHLPYKNTGTFMDKTSLARTKYLEGPESLPDLK